VFERLRLLLPVKIILIDGGLFSEALYSFCDPKNRCGSHYQQKAKEVAQIVDETIRVKYLHLERPSVTSVHAVTSVHESAVARITL
jgi:hypothetical protein